MAKPLTQKQLKAMQKEAQEKLDAQRKQLASLEQSYAALTGKPSPLTDKVTGPSKLAAAESGAIGAAQMASRMPVQVPEGSTAALMAEQAKSVLQLQAEALADPMMDPYYKRNTITGLSPAQVEAKKAVVEAARISKRPIISTGFGNTPIVGGGNVTGAVTTGATTAAITTNIEVLKAMLRSMGFNSSIIDSSSSFLMSLLKEGLDYDNAVAIFLNSKDYTFKDGKKIDSPFYAEYGYLNEGLVRPKPPSELYNAVEGYKEISAKYNLNSKFTSKDFLKKYVKNNKTVAMFDADANTARLKAINADPAYIDALRRLKFINESADLTDFYLDPDLGQETLEQRRATAAFSAEAIRRAGQGVMFDATRFEKTAAGLVNLGLSEAQIGVQAARGFENIAETLKPMAKLEEIYNKYKPASSSAIQQELEAEEFLGTASERRARLKAREIAEYQGEAGTARGLSFNRASRLTGSF
jgi:hypothetical protein